MRPLRMQPVFKERVWGGRRLAGLLAMDLPADRPIGEAWTLADHPNGRTTVADGPLAGQTLGQVLREHASKILGRAGARSSAAPRFPLMVKFIDASDRLSVQVHPDDATALPGREGEAGKTECWVVIDAAPDAWVVDGLKAGTTRPALAEAIRAGTVEDLLVVRPVTAGDFIWVPPGRVHAVGPGVVLAEVQQTSDVTYRAYDWGRFGLDGVPRPLHVREALETIRFKGGSEPAGGRGRTTAEKGLTIDHLVDCHAFSLSRVCLDRRPWAAEVRDAYAVVVAISGRALLSAEGATTALVPGATVLVPADAGEYALRDAENLVCLVAAPTGKAPTR